MTLSFTASSDGYTHVGVSSEEPTRSSSPPRCSRGVRCCWMAIVAMGLLVYSLWTVVLAPQVPACAAHPPRHADAPHENRTCEATRHIVFITPYLNSGSAAMRGRMTVNAINSFGGNSFGGSAKAYLVAHSNLLSHVREHGKSHTQVSHKSHTRPIL